VSIKKWHFKTKDKINTLEGLDIFTGSEITMNAILNLLNLPLEEHAHVTLPKFPIFDNVNCHRLRSLYAVGLGCDVNLNPVVTPAKLLAFITKSPMMQGISTEDAYFVVKKFFVKKFNESNKRTKQSSKTNNNISDNEIDSIKFNEMLDILTDAFIYEPTITTNNNTDKDYTYIFTPPPNNTIHPYLKKIIKDNNDNSININNSTEVLDCCLCAGADDLPHLFLEAEGFCCCTACGKVCCLDCICQNNIGENHFCYECYLPQVSVGQKELELTLTPIELRDELRKCGVDTTTTDDNNELFLIYKAVRENPLYGEKSVVKYPLKAANFLPQLERQKIISIHMKDGGGFIVDDRLSSNQTLQLMTIIAKLVSMYNKNRNNYTDNTYKLVPTTIVGFAEGSCRGK
jgi:hypothetical protein